MFIRHSIGAAAAVLLAGATGAWAQETQRVEITGSNIRRVQAETASPVQTVTREDIEKSGKASVAELLQSLSVDNQGSVPVTFGSGFASGAAGLSLRGLGAASTLVLVNGRRIAPYGLADDGQKVFADINLIPMEAVDRVEIVKDGASSIYGSDAIAGVVNIVLRRDFVGTTVKASVGQSRYGDGTQRSAALTHGFGRLGDDRYNVLLNLEVNQRDEIWNRDRAGRGAVGRADLRDLGFDAQAGLGGAGAILGNNSSSSSSINGNVRNPVTLDYYNRGDVNGAGFTRTFANAACANFTSHPQGDPGHNGARGCLIDAGQLYGQVQPSQESLNLFVRGTLQWTPALQAYGELNLYKSETVSSSTPSTVSASTGYPGGPVSNAAMALGAAHPDNPYFGTAARLRYLSADVGPRVSDVDSTFWRLVAGVKGTVADWDVDTALLHSTNKVSNTRTGYLHREVAFALLNPTAANVAAAKARSAAYAALPAGTLWRIAESAGLNSRELYAALSPTIGNDAVAKTTQVDLKLGRELMPLPGGALALALGAEARRESIRLDPTTGTETGSITGLGYSAYDGARTLQAVYAELLAPVTTQLELSAAARFDHYSDVGNSTTPKLGLKYAPVRQLALRGTWAAGFRAPSAAENGRGGLSAFSNAADPLRCNLGVQSACSPGSVALITSPNPDLVPEKSRSATLGLVFEPMAGTSLALDLWQIRRRDEINQENIDAAIAAGHVARDPSTSTKPGDPGAITAVLAKYVNSAQTTVRGVDLDVQQAFGLGAAGKLKLDAKWTHVFKLERRERDGTVLSFAGTHGNCDTTNCMGTPDDRASVGATWERAAWRVATSVNYRGSMKNVTRQSDTECAVTYADGRDAPAGCRIASFTTVDLNLRWKMNERFEVFGSVLNLFDRVAPLDPLTYGAVSYNPLDYSGAVGRYFSIGVKARI